MFSLVFALLVLLTIIVLIPIVTFSLQCFLSFLPGRKNEYEQDKLPRLAVLIPSHNEEAIVSGIIGDVKSQAKENDRIIVIADNCDDGTADVAREHGVEAFERTDLSDRGKAYALRFALEKLEADPPEVSSKTGSARSRFVHLRRTNRRRRQQQRFFVYALVQESHPPTGLTAGGHALSIDRQWHGGSMARKPEGQRRQPVARRRHNAWLGTRLRWPSSSFLSRSKNRWTRSKRMGHIGSTTTALGARIPRINFKQCTENGFKIHHQVSPWFAVGCF